ncbi:hypothetical protein BD410DRAFT_449261 [Rickenella mellea]|uniref:Uncharacterized protein n=1 Tax=Rickenella mellea TaxID=50990 RepID=A0A4Y7PX10_9AGAM|nr:hypothetical protein BD410DRAFT_449261 [Rickenella mellea]
MPRNPLDDYDLKPGVLVPYGIIDLPFCSGTVELVRRTDVNSDKVSYVRMRMMEATPTSQACNDSHRSHVDDLMRFTNHFESLGTYSEFVIYVDENFKKWVVVAVPKHDMPPGYFPPEIEKTGKD